MESPNLDADLPSEAELEARLKSSPLPPLPDAGFTRAVLAQLPPPRRNWAGWWVYAVGGAIGLAVVFRRPVPWPDLSAAAAQISGLTSGEGLELILLAAAAVGAAALLAAPDETTD